MCHPCAIKTTKLFPFLQPSTILFNPVTGAQKQSGFGQISNRVWVWVLSNFPLRSLRPLSLLCHELKMSTTEETKEATTQEQKQEKEAQSQVGFIEFVFNQVVTLVHLTSGLLVRFVPHGLDRLDVLSICCSLTREGRGAGTPRQGSRIY